MVIFVSVSQIIELFGQQFHVLTCDKKNDLDSVIIWCLRLLNSVRTQLGDKQGVFACRL